jgi:hypothetical protein
VHGFVLNELQRFLDLRFGLGTWSEAQELSGLAGATYIITENYADDDAMALVLTSSALTGVGVEEFSVAFGSFLAAGLLRVYQPFIDPGWSLFDLLARTEESIHAAVRLNDPAAHPPRLRVMRDGIGHVVIEYRSARMLCGLAKGIVTGLSEHYREAVTLDERTCMHRGDSHCTIDVLAH